MLHSSVINGVHMVLYELTHKKTYRHLLAGFALIANTTSNVDQPTCRNALIKGRLTLGRQSGNGGNRVARIQM